MAIIFKLLKNSFIVRKVTRLKPSSRFTVYSSFSLLFMNYKLNCMEDEIIKNSRLHIENEIAKMKKEFGTQMATYPNVVSKIIGNKYHLEFELD